MVTLSGKELVDIELLLTNKRHSILSKKTKDLVGEEIIHSKGKVCKIL